MNTVSTLLVCVFGLALLSGGGEIRAEDGYRLETIPFPKGVPPEVGAIGFNPSGELVVALRRSDVLIARPTEDPNQFEWRLFASGLHNACGMHVVSDQEVIISQMPELTRLVDTNGDGSADWYETLNASWGMSGNYHETNHLTPDGEGGYFLAIGTASHNGPVFYNVRGTYSKTGRRGRNYSAASWKGWVLHVDADGVMTPFCKGFRMHNGILRDRNGNLWAGDNQGDWRATTPFYHLKKNQFYGHPSSLVWDPEWDSSRDPLKVSLQEWSAMRTPAAVLLPHDIMNRSASEPIQIPESGFGPYGGQILLPDNNGKRISRLMLEEVDGQFQGACTHFWNENGLNLGNNRVVFSPDRGTLYVGQTSRGWGALAEGVQRIIRTKESVTDILTMSLTPNGFRLRFTGPVPDSVRDPGTYRMKSYRYEDGPSYGGEKLDTIKVAIPKVLRVDDFTVDLPVEGLKDGGHIYELSVDAEGLRSNVFCYTINRLRKE
ncbi:MAG: hypothetical protein P1U87_13235 [Verrucomicrobiales bacterium]|nr:hypothetical protein [Verrucomicrobiales bacterium]